MCSDLLPDMFYNQLQHEGGFQILSRKSSLMIEIVTCSKRILRYLIVKLKTFSGSLL